MKQRELIDARAPRRFVLNRVVKIRIGQFAVKDVVSIDAEGVWITETVSGDRVALVNENGVAHWRSIPDNARSLTITIEKWRNTYTQ